MPDQPDPGLVAIGQIAINTHDIERATAFYRDTLGLTHLFSAGPLAFFDCGGVRLMLSVAESPEFDHPSSIIYFRVDDVRDSHAALAGAVEFIEGPQVIHRTEEYELWMAFFRDPDGNPLAFMSELPPGTD